jgi:hypothetical protein
MQSTDMMYVMPNQQHCKKILNFLQKQQVCTKKGKNVYPTPKLKWHIVPNVSRNTIPEERCKLGKRKRTLPQTWMANTLPEKQNKQNQKTRKIMRGASHN